MGFIKKHRLEILVSLIIGILYFFLRLIFLTRLPIFTDEAIYLRWAQIALHDSSWRFISLTDGKQPLFVWVAMIFIKFIHDPLIAGRLVSVLSGFLTMIGLWFLAYELFKNKTTAFLSSALYVFYPFAQVLDRMALYDSMVATFYVWALYVSILLVRKVRLDIAYTLGFVIAGGVLTKSSNFFSIYLLPFTLILFNFKENNSRQKLFKYVLFAFLAAAISYGLYNILRLSPFFQIIATKNATFIYPFSEWIKHPLEFLFSNLSGLTSWFVQYFTPSYLILIFISILFIKKFIKEKLVLLIYFLFPFLALALFGKLIYPRYMFLMSVMLLPLAAWSVNFLFEKLNKIFFKNTLYLNIAKITLFSVIIAYPLYVSILFATDPVKAPIADSDHGQYTNNWSAGWGVNESVAFFSEQAKNQKIFIATEGTFGLMPAAMEMYLIQNSNVTIRGYWPIENVLPKEVLNYAKRMPSYMIFYQPQHVVIPSDFPLKLLFQVKQGNTNYYYRVYQVVAAK